MEDHVAPTLQAIELTHQYKSLDVLRGVDLEVNPAEVVAIMGPSGSGKTTLLRCLAGITAPSGGAVFYKGDDLSSLSQSEWALLRRREFGFIYQDGQLFPELNVIENAALVLMLNGHRRKLATQEASEWLDRVGIGHLAERKTSEISGGEAQRVAIARAMTTRPSVIFADEPTGSLDARTGAEVMDMLVDAVRSQNASLVLITHDPVIAEQADRIQDISDGVVIERQWS